MRKSLLFSVTLMMLPIFTAAEEQDCISAYYSQKREAHQICSLAASRNDVNAIKIIGDMFYWGWADIVEKDYKEALEWYVKAAQEGNSEAKFNLGVLYENGKGVAVDFNRAFKWYLSAAQDGHPVAQFNIGNMYSKGAGVTQNQNHAARWYLKAAEQGDVDAQYNIGNRYALGNGVSENLVEAYKWYLIASNNGDVDAGKNLSLLAEEMTENQINEAKTLADNWRPKWENGGFKE